jgi:hypothetical protein
LVQNISLLVYRLLWDLRWSFEALKRIRYLIWSWLCLFRLLLFELLRLLFLYDHGTAHAHIDEVLPRLYLIL